MPDTRSFTLTEGLPIPITGDVNKAVIVSASIKKIDSVLADMYASATADTNVFLFGNGEIIAFGDGTLVGF